MRFLRSPSFNSRFEGESSAAVGLNQLMEKNVTSRWVACEGALKYPLKRIVYILRYVRLLKKELVYTDGAPRCAGRFIIS